jgi:hypothetical protein
MINRRTLRLLAVALVALCLPVMAAAQGGYYGNDRYGRNYNNRALRDSVQRVKDRSDNFEDHLDSALDRSRYDDSRREDRINDVAKEFQRAAEQLDDRFDNGRNLTRSSNEARRLLQLGSQIDRFMARNRLGGRAESEWARIRQDLHVIANAYGFNWGDFDDRYRRDDDYNRRRGNNRRW